MSHLIVEGIDKVFTPDSDIWRETWHGLQTVVQGRIVLDGSNIQEAFCPIVQCGLKPDYTGQICTVPIDCQDETSVQLQDFKLIMADCSKGFSGKIHPLYVPKKGYVIHQNKSLFDSMVSAAQTVLGDKFEIVTVGTLGGYSQFFMSIAIQGIESFEIGKLGNGHPDKYRQFFNLNSSHNGLIASNCMLSMVRMVCMNTVQMSISDATERGTLSVIKHSLNSEALITPVTFEKNLSAWINQTKSFQDNLQALKAQTMSLEQFQAFTAGVFTNEGSDSLSTISFNRIADLTGLFQRGKGNEGKTRYDALNAFTEYFTNGNGVGKRDNVSANKRLATANFGKGNDWKITAMQTVCDPELFSATLKRGEILYADKLVVQAQDN